MPPRGLDDRRPAPSGAGLGLLVAAVLLIGLNQRPAITAIPPVQDLLADDLGIGPALTGALTSVPLLCFAVVGLVVPALVRRLGVDVTMLGGLVLLTLAVALRPWGGATLLFAGTVAVGAAITVANVLQPVVVRRDAPPGRVGLLMPLSTAALSTGAALASLVAVDIEDRYGWRTMLALLAVPAALAAILWGVRMAAARARRPGRGGRAQASGGTAVPGSGATAATESAMPAVGTARRSPWGDVDAWWLALFFAIQSTLFYIAAAWLPAILADRAGVGRTEGGFALTLYFLLGIAGSLLTPLFVRVLGSYRRASPAPGVLWGVTFAGLLLAPAAWPLWAVIAGVGQGIGIGMGMTLIAVRPIDAVHGRSVSAMVQSAAYALAALGPAALGGLYGVTGDWFAGCLVGVGLAICQVLAGVPATGDRPIGAPRREGGR